MAASAIFKSTDASMRRLRHSDADVGAFAIHPQRPDTLYAGGCGTTWKDMNEGLPLPTGTLTIGALLDPHDSNIVYTTTIPREQFGTDFF